MTRQTLRPDRGMPCTEPGANHPVSNLSGKPKEYETVVKRDKQAGKRRSPGVRRAQMPAEDLEPRVTQRVASFPTPGLNEFWSKLSPRVRGRVVSEIGYFLGLWSELKIQREKWLRRKSRADALIEEIKALKLARRSRMIFEAKEEGIFGGVPFWREAEARFGAEPLSETLHVEILKLEGGLAVIEEVKNEIRNGRRRSKLDLIRAQELVVAWGQALGTPLELKPAYISSLIEIALSLTENEFSTEFETPNIRMAIANFRAHRLNQNLIKEIEAASAAEVAVARTRG